MSTVGIKKLKLTNLLDSFCFFHNDFINRFFYFSLIDYVSKIKSFGPENRVFVNVINVSDSCTGSGGSS